MYINCKKYRSVANQIQLNKKQISYNNLSNFILTHIHLIKYNNLKKFVNVLQIKKKKYILSKRTKSTSCAPGRCTTAPSYCCPINLILPALIFSWFGSFILCRPLSSMRKKYSSLWASTIINDRNILFTICLSLSSRNEIVYNAFIQFSRLLSQFPILLREII